MPDRPRVSINIDGFWLFATVAVLVWGAVQIWGS